MPSHVCSPEELGLQGDNPKYMEPRPDNLDYVELYQKKFLCLDESDRYVSGNFNTKKASLIRVRLNKCRNKAYCKSDADITKFVKGKFLLVYMN